MKYAMLTPAELRLLDVLLQRGIFSDPPASITRSDVGPVAPAGTRPGDFPNLRQRLPGILAISRRIDGVLAHGSIAELLSVLARPPRRDPPPG